MYSATMLGSGGRSEKPQRRHYLKKLSVGRVGAPRVGGTDGLGIVEGATGERMRCAGPDVARWPEGDGARASSEGSSVGRPISMTMSMISGMFGADERTLLNLRDCLPLVVLPCRSNVGSRKIVALEEERLVAKPGQSVGKAVAVIERSRMPPLAVSSPGTPSLVCMLGRNGHDLHLRFVQPEIELCSSCLAKSSLDYHRSFNKRRCGKQSHGIIGNMLPIHWSIRLTKEDRDDRGRIDHHQLGTPFSS